MLWGGVIPSGHPAATVVNETVGLAGDEGDDGDAASR